MPTRSSKELLAEANAAVETIPVEQAVTMAGDQDVVFVDVREGAEREKGTVKGSVHASRGFPRFLDSQIELLQTFRRPSRALGARAARIAAHR